MHRSECAASIPALSDAVIVKYCPVLYLHHHDAYLPVSIEWFIERANLYYYRCAITGGGGIHELSQVPGGATKLIAEGEVTQEKLLEVQADVEAKGQNPDNLSLTVGAEHYGGTSADRVCDVPIYAHAKLVVDEYGDPEAYEINYITYYAYNGHYDLPAGLPVFRQGHHVGDWEHLTVRLDATSLELQGVWYNAHRNIEGEWCPAELVPHSPCGRILGYVAINGHGIYPTCGTIPRLFFLANDRTSDRGPVWNPTRVVRLCGLAHGSGCPIVQSRGCSLPVPPPWSQPAFGNVHTPSALHVTDIERAEAGLSLQHHGNADQARQPLASTAMAGGAGGSPAAADGTAGASAAVLEAEAGAAQGATTGGSSFKAVGAAAATKGRARAGFPLPVVVHDASPWQRYRGRWGTIVSATQQGWFLGPEPPVSRGLIRRLFLPCVGGVDRLPRRRRPLSGTTGTIVHGLVSSLKAVLLTPERPPGHEV